MTALSIGPEAAKCGWFLVAPLAFGVFLPRVDERGWGKVGVGEGTGRREKVEEGRGRKRRKKG